MGYIYIGNDPQHQEFLERFVPNLKQAGVDLRRPTDIMAPGEDWGSGKLLDAIQAADIRIQFAAKDSLLAASIDDDAEVDLGGSFIFITLVEGNEIPKPGIRFSQTGQLIARFFIHPQYDKSELAAILNVLPNTVKLTDISAASSYRSKGYLFISYAEEDTMFVKRLRQFLKECGYGYWDYQDSTRNHQSVLRKELEEALRGASAAAFILSPSWKASEWTQDEYDFAVSLKLPVFRLMTRQMEETFGITTRLWIDFMNDESEGFAKLDNELRRAGLI